MLLHCIVSLHYCAVWFVLLQNSKVLFMQSDGGLTPMSRSVHFDDNKHCCLSTRFRLVAMPKLALLLLKTFLTQTSNHYFTSTFITSCLSQLTALSPAESSRRRLLSANLVREHNSTMYTVSQKSTHPIMAIISSKS